MTKNLERKKKGQTQGRANRRMPICNPTIQLVVVDLYTKYEVSILNGCGDIFDEKCYGITEGRTEGRTDGRTDGTTDRCKPVYPPLFQSGGITRLYGWGLLQSHLRFPNDLFLQELEVWFLSHIWCPSPVSQWLPKIFIQIFKEYLRAKLRAPVFFQHNLGS